MKVLITGAGGFVGKYLIEEFQSNGYEVVPTDIRGDNIVILDATSKQNVLDVLSKYSPDYLVHLAGFSSVRDSYNFPEKCMQINYDGTKNLFEAITELNLKTKVLVISSADTYITKNEGELTEDSPEAVTSPYSLSRVKQKEYVTAHPEVAWIISKSFPHIGAGQRLGFVTADIGSQVAKATESQKTIVVGDLSAIRDFANVRDVVRAYRLLLEKGKLHEVYNVCTGEGHSIKEIVEEFINVSGKDLTIESNPELFRKTEIPRLVGDNSKIVRETGWKPEISFKETIKEIYNYWHNLEKNG